MADLSCSGEQGAASRDLHPITTCRTARIVWLWKWAWQIWDSTAIPLLFFYWLNFTSLLSDFPVLDGMFLKCLVFFPLTNPSIKTPSANLEGEELFVFKQNPFWQGLLATPTKCARRQNYLKQWGHGQNNALTWFLLLIKNMHEQAYVLASEIRYKSKNPWPVFQLNDMLCIFSHREHPSTCIHGSMTLIWLTCRICVAHAEGLISDILYC